MEHDTAPYKEPAPILDKENPFESMMQRFDVAAHLLNLDPGFYERKLDQGYSLPQIAAYVGCLCLADAQSQRGHFRDLVVLKALLGPGARHVPVLLERGDLVMVGKRVYVEGWDEWQEGDWQVK